MQNTNTILTVRTQKVLKNKVEKILRDLGLTHSSAINIFYRLIIMNKGIPFDVKIPNETTQKAMEESRANKNLKGFKNADELFGDLNI
jgi:DNA-damage-inducible protein J